MSYTFICQLYLHSWIRKCYTVWSDEYKNCFLISEKLKLFYKKTVEPNKVLFKGMSSLDSVGGQFTVLGWWTHQAKIFYLLLNVLSKINASYSVK